MRTRLTILLTAALILLALPALAHQTGAEHTHLDLDADATLDKGGGWGCTYWHELWPNYCAISHLRWIEGDGQLKACNFAVFSDGRYHIDWVGPTYFWDCGFVTEPSGDITAQVEPGDVHDEVWPDHGETHTVEGWEDADGDGELSPCDVVYFSDGAYCHLRRIGLNIIISPAPDCAVETCAPVPLPIDK